MSFFSSFEFPDEEAPGARNDGEGGGGAGGEANIELLAGAIERERSMVDVLAGAVEQQQQQQCHDAAAKVATSACEVVVSPNSLYRAIADVREAHGDADGDGDGDGGAAESKRTHDARVESAGAGADADVDMVDACGMSDGTEGTAPPYAEAKDSPADSTSTSSFSSRGSYGSSGHGSSSRASGAHASGAHGSGASAERTRALLERQKSSSTSTVFLKSTIDVPDVDRILLSVSVLLQKMIAVCEDPDSDPFLRCLPARARARMSVPRVHDPHSWDAAEVIPSVQEIFQFANRCFRIAKWSPEANIIAMVLMTRLATGTDVELNDRNWDKLLLCAFLLAQKMWDDTPLGNVDFPLLWSQVNNIRADFDLRAINHMEKLFLNKLHYDIHVDRKTYTQFYFELNALTQQSQPGAGAEGGGGRAGGLLKPISAEAAAKLEVRSAAVQRRLDTARRLWSSSGAAQPKGGNGKGRGDGHKQDKGLRAPMGSATVTLGSRQLGKPRSGGGRVVLD